ncbi:hypothetical protein BS78_02G368100 [Paspalum vaginatum]|nr:hypothetical protein BS78_02G368100 [Paspalum vaginatum]
MAGFLTPITEWTIRAVVVMSLCAHLVLTLFANVRRRQRSGVRTAVLWSAYQVADWAAPFVLSNLSLGSTSAEQQLVAFWLPFLLTHLGGPDNITAYSFEDNKISLRQAISTLLRFQGVSFAIYRQYKVVTSKGALFWASAAVVAVGVAKYVERVRALRSADFGNIRSARDERSPKTSIQSHGRRGEELDDDQALFVAHQLLRITKGAFADYSVKVQAFKDDNINNLEEMFSYKSGWGNMCKVVEMELSLMYDILYTKAAMIHTWGGYLIRVVSPVATGTMMVLFWFHRKDGQRRADVTITYILLMVSFLLDVRWLLGAIASTWAYAFFHARPAGWLHHEIFCSGRWHRFRRAMVSLDPGQLIFRSGRGSYRLWSGAIGQYNLFDECTHGTTSLCRRLVTWVASEDTWIEHRYSTRCKLGKPCINTSRSIRKLLFDQIQKTLSEAYPRHDKKREKEEEEKKKKGEARPVGAWAPEEADDRGARRYLLDKALGFVPEFQELVLILHVATDVFLVITSNDWQFSHTEEVCKEAIQATSNYMAFLAAARPDMLPGLNLRSLYNETREALLKIWQNGSRRSSSKHSLACTLQSMEKKNRTRSNLGSKSELQDRSFILSEGVIIAEVLLAMLSSPYPVRNIRALLGVDPNGEGDGQDWKDRDSKWRQRILFLIKLLIPGLGNNGTRGRGPYRMEQLLELLLESWVRMLINVSTRCSGDSHARQLGRGCELTTIVWILGEHASILGVSRT